VPHDSDAPLFVPSSALFQLELRGRAATRWLFFGFLIALALDKTQLAIPARILTVIAIAWLVVTIGLAMFLVAFEFSFRCASCGQRPLVQSVSRPPFPGPHRQQALRTGIFQCQYCGQRYLVGPTAGIAQSAGPTPPEADNRR